MRFDFSMQQAGRPEQERRQHMWRAVKGAFGSILAGGAGLIFGFAMGLHDARWSDAWTHVGYASSLFAAPVGNGIARNGALHNG